MVDWKYPNTITGDAATGSCYFKRNYINEEFWREIQKGNHILFVAPRRVGKTSIMKDLCNNPMENYHCIYQDIEGTKTKNEFYKRLYNLLLNCVGKSARGKSLIGKWSEQYGIEEITTHGIKFKSGKEPDYEKQLLKLIPNLKEEKIYTVIFLDEFAEVIYKIKKEDAVEILYRLRELRNDDNFSHFKIVFAGSIGLHYVVRTIDRPKVINDLHPIETGPLDVEEGILFINQIITGATIEIAGKEIKYLLAKLRHLLPYFIQLMVEEINQIAKRRNQPLINNSTIDEAFDNVLRSNKNFEDWLIRLRDYIPEHFSFINEILITCCHNNRISVQEIYNIAANAKNNRTDDYMDFVEQLITDGYIVEFEKNMYRFVSPFLQQFWIKKFPIKK